MSDEDLDQGNEQIEREARAQGWRPQDQFKGPEGAWVDADTFVQRGKEIRGYMKRENEDLKRQLAAATSQVGEMKGTIEEIKKYHADMEERAIEAATARLKRERKAALAAGNNELAADLEEDIEELRDAPRLAPKPAEKKPETTTETGQQKLPPEFLEAANAWQRQNAWYVTNNPDYEDEIAYANGLAQRILTRNDLTPQQRFDLLDEKVKAMFPDRFEPAPRTRNTTTTTGTGEGSGREGSKGSKKGVSALPDDARQAGMRFVKQGLYKDLEAYATEYFNQKGARA